MTGSKRKKDLPDTSAVVVAAGNATRMMGIEKQLAQVDGVPVLIRSLQALACSPSICEIIVVTREQLIPVLHQMISAFGVNKVRTILTGGATRQQSVRKGFAQISPQGKFVAIHDGARPLVRPEEIEACIAVARRTGAAVLGTPVKDTIKQVDGEGRVTATPGRSALYAVQTPQVFSSAAYGAAVEKADAAGMDFTDDCQLLEYAGMPVQVVRGSYDNIKITTPEDLAVAEGLLAFREQWEEEVQ